MGSFVIPSKIPNASATKRGLVSTGTQTFAGAKTFSVIPSLPDGYDYQTVTTAAMTLYVETTGSDSNPGTALAPFLTVQAAIDALPKCLRHLAMIKIGIGSFAGCIVQGFSVDPVSNDLPAGLLMQGTLVNATLATGTATGTFTAVTAGSSALANFVTLEDTSQNWTTNALKGLALEVLSGTSSGQIHAIVSNTSTTVTLASASIGSVGGTYCIRDGGTSFTSSIKCPVSIRAINVTNTTSTLTACMLVQDCSFNVHQFRTECIKFNPTSSTFYGINLISCNGTIGNCFFGGNVSISPIRVAGLVDLLLIQRCVIVVTTSTSNTISLEARGAISILNCCSTGTSSSKGVQLQAQVALTMTQSYMEHAFCLSFIGGLTGCSTLLDGCRFVSTSSQCIVTRMNANLSGGTNYINATGLHLTGGAGSNAIELVGPHMMYVTTLTVASGLVGASLQMGARLQLGSASSITAGTEIMLDGSSTNLSTMRAVTPKILTTSYGTTVHE